MQPKQTQSTAEKLLEEAARRAERNQLSKKDFSELKKACRSIFATRNGQIVARAMMRFSGVYNFPKNLTNPIVMGEERGKEFMYLFFVKNMVSSETLSQIEIQIEKE